MTRVLLIFLFLVGCKEWGSICHDIIIPNCDYEKTPKKCEKLEQEECDRRRIKRMGK